MDKRAIVALMIVLSGLLVWSAGSSSDRTLAQEDGGVGAQAAVAPLLQYQGRLTDPGTGEPVDDGVFTMVFRLWDAESGGTELWSEMKDVTVEGGVFSTALGDTTALDPAWFSGQGLWLGIKVGTDAEATPRQPLLPVPYALGLAPGAVISTTSSSPALAVHNAGSGEALEVGGDMHVSGNLNGGSHTHSGSEITSGTVDEAWIDADIARNNEILPTIIESGGAGSGLDADMVDGYQAAELMSGGGIGSAAGTTTIYGSTTSNNVEQMDSFTVYVPGAGTLTLFVFGSGMLDCHATSSSSQLCTGTKLGICDTAGSSTTCGQSYRELYYEDPDDASPFNAQHWITVARTVVVSSEGPRTFYLNGQSFEEGKTWLVQGYVVGIFTPDSMTMTNP
ncbi:MAG: hypothetical protein PVH41_08620 [Anaerolineae bacterium]|jgi:hypothetical protein